MFQRLRVGLCSVLLLAALLLVPMARAAEQPAQQPRTPPAGRDPRFGIVQSIHAPDLAQAAGASWERIIFPWSRMEPRPGSFEPGDFSRAQIEAQVARGFTEVGVVIYTPDWAAWNPVRPHPKSVPRNLYLPWDHPDNYWGQFTGRLAANYRGLVDHWVIWNEPDLYDHGSRWFFDGSFEDYYQLLKVSYQAIKANNPQAKVIMAGMAYWFDRGFDRPPYLASLLEVAGRDPSARANDWYFDIVAVHTYTNPLNSYTQPMIMRRIMEERGIQKPIWIMESNAVPSDDPKAPTESGPFRASQVQQAAYLIQSFALGIAAGVERQSVYKLLDETPEDGQYFGLVRNDRSVRPAFTAFQVASTYLSGAQWASYTWNNASLPPRPDEVENLLRSVQNRTQFIWPGEFNRVVVERGDRRTTVVWNTSPRPLRVEVQAAAPAALAVDQAGGQGQVLARNGVYTLDLPPSTHNSDPRDPSAYLIGGQPWILEESVVPLPRQIRSRVGSFWPHNWAPVEQAERANLRIELETGDGEPVPCRWEPLVQLWMSTDDGLRKPVGTGTRVMVSAGEVRYPAWQFDNISIGAARTGSFLTFSVTVDGVDLTAESFVYGGESPSPLEPAPVPERSCR
jgi:hypothetical protein